MTMGRNESVARIFMWLCFGTAILSLAVHWRMISEQRQQIEADSSTQLRRDPTMAEAAAVSASKARLRKAGKNVDTVSLNNDRSDVGESRHNSTSANPPKFLLAQNFAKSKSSDGVNSGKSQVVVDLSDRRAYVYTQDQVIASYPIAVGKKGWETPTGSFQVMQMQHYAVWRHPITGKVFPAGTDSPLGDRWIGFWSDGRNQIGFHGTPDVEVIGTAISHGCIRMRNPDVRMLYQQVGMGTTVVVRD